MDAQQTDPNTSEQSALSATNQTTTTKRAEKNKYKIPISSDRETDLIKIISRMWWEQILEYSDVTYYRNLDVVMDQVCTYRIQHQR